MSAIGTHEAQTMWVLLPYQIRDGVIVYKKCRVNKLVQKGRRWSDEIDAVYADFVHDKNEGLVVLEAAIGEVDDD